MYLANKKSKKVIIIIGCLVLVAWLMRFTYGLGQNKLLQDLTSILRPYIYIGVFIYWGFTLKQRIVQISTRRYLWIMATTMVAWVVIRTVKYTSIEVGSTAERYMWYAYYCPMLIIPLMGLLAALCFSKPENYRPPRWTYVFHGLSALFIICVFTNDFHQLVFPYNNEINADSNHSYGIVYFFITAFIFTMILSTYVIILKRGRLPNRKTAIITPVIFMCIAIAYAVCYAIKLSFIKPIAGDMTIFFCVMCMCLWESCIQVGMISVNMKYRELVNASQGISVQILDSDRNLRFFSRNTIPIDRDTVIKAESDPVMLTDNIKLSHFPIRAGHVLWQEDMTELLDIMEELEETKKTLQDDTMIVREEYNSKLRKLRLEEQNRLYDKMQRETEMQIKLITKLLELWKASYRQWKIIQNKGAEVTQNENDVSHKELRNILIRMTVLGTYLKRRSNLLLTADNDKIIYSLDLKHCFEESLSNIEMMCPNCSLRMELPEKIEIEVAMRIYDFFEAGIEVAGGSLEALLIHIYEDKENITIRMEIESDKEISFIRDDDGAQIMFLSVPEGRNVQ